MALLTVAPIFLRVGSFERVERQTEIKARGTSVRAARRASLFVGITVIKVLETFGATTPIRLIRHLELLKAE